MLKVSQSKLKLFRQCRAAYAYKYIEGLRPKAKKRPLTFGSIVHEMIEAHANGHDPFEVLDKIAKENENLFRAEAEELGDIVGDCRMIMSEYFDYWSNDPIKYHEINGLNAEHEFEVDLIKHYVILTGKIDAIGSVNDLDWLVEHKTFSRMPSDDDRWRNVQSAIYKRAMDMLGFKPVDGTVWDYVRSKPPTRPKILKSGELSTRELDTLPSAVMEVISQNGLNPLKYQSQLSAATENRSNYFMRIFTPLKKKIVDLIWEDAQESALDILDFEDCRLRPVKTIGLHCGHCDYEKICRAQMLQLDYDFVKETEYTVEKR